MVKLRVLVGAEEQEVLVDEEVLMQMTVRCRAE